MDPTKMNLALIALVEAAKAHSYIQLGEDAVELPEDWSSVMDPADAIAAVTRYLSDTA